MLNLLLLLLAIPASLQAQSLIFTSTDPYLNQTLEDLDNRIMSNTRVTNNIGTLGLTCSNPVGSCITFPDGSTQNTAPTAAAVITDVSTVSTWSGIISVTENGAGLGPCVAGTTVTFGSGATPLYVFLNGSAGLDTNAHYKIGFLLDGAQLAPYTATLGVLEIFPDLAGFDGNVSFSVFIPTVTAGSHSACLTTSGTNLSKIFFGGDYLNNNVSVTQFGLRQAPGSGPTGATGPTGPTGPANGWTRSAPTVYLNTATDNAVIQSTLTVQGNAFSVGVSTFVITGSSVGVRILSPTYALDVLGEVNASGNYRNGGTVGVSKSCAAGQYLDNETDTGGIVTGGSCLAVGAAALPGQATYTIAGTTNTITADSACGTVACVKISSTVAAAGVSSISFAGLAARVHYQVSITSYTQLGSSSQLMAIYNGDRGSNYNWGGTGVSGTGTARTGGAAADTACFLDWSTGTDGRMGVGKGGVFTFDFYTTGNSHGFWNAVNYDSTNSLDHRIQGFCAFTSSAIVNQITIFPLLGTFSGIVDLLRIE